MTKAPEAGIIGGFAGKIPARGDFVHGGLPRDFVEPWYDWLERALAGSRAMMGEAWLDAFLEAPVWRFVLPPDLCGPRAAMGLMLPSVDKVGRYFPLTFAALSPASFPVTDAASDDIAPIPPVWTDWLDQAEDLGRRALDEDLAPDTLMPSRTPLPITADRQTAALWWTEGGPRVAATRFTLTAHPDPACYARMLGHHRPSEAAS